MAELLTVLGEPQICMLCPTVAGMYFPPEKHVELKE